MTQVGIGVIGAGRHGIRYIRHLMAGDVPGARLVGVARRDPGRAGMLEAEVGCRTVVGYQELLSLPELDAVAVVVPPDRHPEIVEAAAVRGKAVLLEKPAALSVTDGLGMLRASRKAGIPVMVAQTLRFNGVVKALEREIDGIAPVHALRLSQRFEPSPLAWVDNPLLGGILFHTGVHSFDLVNWYSRAAADRVSCVAGRVGDVQAPNHFSAVVEMSGGSILATVSGCRATASRTGAIELAGAGGQLVGDHVLNTAFRITGKTTQPLEVSEDIPTVMETVGAFVTALRNETPMPIALEDGLRATALAEAAAKAARSGQAEPVTAIE